MPLAVIVSGSPVPGSRTRAVGDQVGRALAARGLAVQSVDVRDLPAADLLWACTEAPAIRAAIALVRSADAVVLVTPVYNGAYSGALKALLDLLPQHALAGKVVLPIAIGGSLAHVLAIDYALRPVLASMGGPHVVGGQFLADGWMPRAEGGRVLLDHEEVCRRLATGVDQLAAGLRPGASTEMALTTSPTPAPA
jgi:FMN reductase